MADLSGVLRKTIDGLPRATPQMRAKVYDKARTAIQRQIDAANPPLAESIVATRLAALEDAIARTETHYAALGTIPKEPSDTLKILPVELQTESVMRFRDNPEGKIDADVNEGSDQLQDNEDARDRHSEVQAAAENLLQSYNMDQRGGNAAAEVVTAITRFCEALGKTPRQVRPGLLIPRGEALRELNNLQERSDDEYTDVAPLSDRMRSALRLLVRSYNVYVGLDSILARRDEVRLGPDALRGMIGPDEGQKASISIYEAGISTKLAASALGEEAANAPLSPSPDDRRSRRYSEGLKNLVRALLAKARTVATQPATKKALVISGAAAGASLSAAKWAIANEEWIVTVFSENPIMSEIIRDLIAALKTLPLAGI